MESRIDSNVIGNYYDVTKCDFGNPFEDIGAVINDIILDIKSKQKEKDNLMGGKPGGVIFIPSGDYHLKTQVIIDVSFLKIIGTGHGFTSSSIRFNTEQNGLKEWKELWPGGSRIIVDLNSDSEIECAAFYIKREGSPRVSSVEFDGFNIDGGHFIDDKLGKCIPENSYVNKKTGIYIDSANDSFKICNMGFIYLEHGIISHNTDAINIHNNFIAECGNCIELRGSGQASKVSDNLMGAGYKGYTVYAENFGGLLVSGNNIFPRGKSSIYFNNVAKSNVTSNRIHAFYPGVIIFKDSYDNLISSNHILRDSEPWEPMKNVGSDVKDSFGLVRIEGSRNSIVGNHISECMDLKSLNPKDQKPVIIDLFRGIKNYIAMNHIVATVGSGENLDSDEDACFLAQVGAILSGGSCGELEIIAVKIEEESKYNVILDTGVDEEIIADREKNYIRAIPGLLFQKMHE